MKKTNIYSLEFPEGNIRYIGKANDVGKRFVSHLSRVDECISKKNSWIKSLVKEGNIPIINIIDEVDIEEWQFWESHYIFLYRSYGFKLTNLTFGGGGLTNPTQEIKKKISDKLKENYENGQQPWNKGIEGVFVGENSHNFGIIRTQEEKEKQRDIKIEYYKQHNVWNKGIKTGHTPWNKDKKGVMPEVWNKGTKGVMKAWNKGIEMKEESKEKCSINSSHNRKVIQFTTDGEFVKEFMSAQKAIEEIKANGVNSCCSGKSKSAGGFLWIWKDEFSEELLNTKIYEFKHKNLNYSRGSGSENACAKPVEQIDINTGETIKVFGSISEANKEVGKGNIGAVCRRERSTACGYKWRYKEESVCQNQEQV